MQCCCTLAEMPSDLHEPSLPNRFFHYFFLANSRKKESQLGYFSVTTGANRRVAM